MPYALLCEQQILLKCGYLQCHIPEHRDLNKLLLNMSLLLLLLLLLLSEPTLLLLPILLLLLLIIIIIIIVIIIIIIIICLVTDLSCLTDTLLM
jgi:hypothetical protein